MGWEIRPKRAEELETVADDLAWVIWEAQRALADTPQMFVIPALLKEVGIQFGKESAA